MPLLAALTPPSWSVTHTDEITRAVDTRQRWDVVGITAATPGAPHAYDLAREFRASGARVVMGGPHATLLPYEAAQHVDIVVAGEAESVWPRVLRDIEHETRYATGRHLLDVRTGANVEALPAGSRIYRCPTPATLSGLPPARRDLIHHGGWNKWWATRAPTIATRGCPHSCDYCTIPLVYPQARRMRFRPVEEVAAEVGRVPDKGIVFWDDNIAANPRYAKALFRALAPLGKWWTSQATMASLQDDELLALAAASGCKALFVGLESISQASLAGAGKAHNRVADYASLLQRLHAHGIALQAGIMFGFDGDDPDIFARTVDVFGKLGLDNATISLLVPYPRDARLPSAASRRANPRRRLAPLQRQDARRLSSGAHEPRHPDGGVRTGQARVLLAGPHPRAHGEEPHRAVVERPAQPRLHVRHGKRGRHPRRLSRGT